MSEEFKHPVPIVTEPNKVYCGIYRAWFTGSPIVEFTNFPKVYIGQGKIFRNRKRSHTYALNNQRHFNIHLQRAFNKYGKDNFNVQLIEECLESELDNMEVYYVALYKSNQSEYGYNLNSGGNRPVMSEEVRERISKSHIGKEIKQSTRDKLRDANLGKKIPLEQRKRQSETMKAVAANFTDEQRAKISQATSYKRSDETKRKMSEANIGKVPSVETKLKLAVFNLQQVRPNSKVELVDGEIYIDGYLYMRPKYCKPFRTPPEMEIFLKEKEARKKAKYEKLAKTMTGRKRPAEVVAKIAKANTGRKTTPEQKQILRIRQLEYWEKVREQNGGINVKAFKVKKTNINTIT